MTPGTPTTLAVSLRLLSLAGWLLPAVQPALVVAPCLPADVLHPQDRTRHRVLMDLFVGLVWATALDLARRPIGTEDEEVAQASGKGLARDGHCIQETGNEVQLPWVHTGGQRDAGRLAPKLVRPPVQEVLLAPMVPGNLQQRSSTCLLQRHFEQIVVMQEGFENERPTSPMANKKWGWIGEQASSWAELEVDTTTDLKVWPCGLRLADWHARCMSQGQGPD